MKKALLIAEKPSLMRDIQAAYNKNPLKDLDIDFASFVGHVVSLQQPKDYKPEWEKWDAKVLPMIPERFVYQPTPSALNVYKDLVSKIKKGNYDYIINACDAGREGQHIFHAFYDSLGLKIPTLRLWAQSTTETELSKALNTMKEYDKTPMYQNMTHASKLRAYFDWLIGLNSTRAITVNNKHFGFAVPVGRVMTPTLRIIVDRELEIRNFVPKPFWEIKATFKTDKNETYEGTYFDETAIENPSRLDKKELAEKIQKGLANKGEITSLTKKKQVSNAPNLHSLQQLSNEANRAFGYTMAETLGIVQSLYEKKILSYPRTDSTYITTELAKDFPKMLNAAKMVPGLDKVIDAIAPQTVKAKMTDKKYVDDKKVSDHYAIVPTGVTASFGNLPQKEQNILTLVCKRLVAIFLDPMVKEKTEIITEVEKHKFKTTGSVLLDIGYMSIYNQKSTDSELPILKKGEVVAVKDTEVLEKKTTPPSRFTDETLGSIMENVARLLEDGEMKDVLKDAGGLGTSATRGGIVEKLININMIGYEGKGKIKSIVPTDFGINLIKSLGDRDITKPELTAQWELRLKGIEEGNLNPRQVLNEMIEYTRTVIDELVSRDFDIKNPSYVPKGGSGKSAPKERESIGTCPKCKSKNVIMTDKYYLCEGYKDTCDFLISQELKGAKITKTEAKKLISGKETKDLTFTWSPGKKGEAKLKWENGKLNFIFPPRK